MKDTLIFTLALILGSIGHIATDIYLPSMPHIVRNFETTTTLVQLTFSAYMLSFCIVPLIVGPLSDRIGRKRPILMGIMIGFISTLLCAFSTSVYVLIFARFLQGIGMGMIVSTARAILPDYFNGAKLTRYFSYMTMGMALVLAIAPPLGGVIQDMASWRMTFIVMAIYLAIVFGLILFVMKDKTSIRPSHQGIAHYFISYKELFTNPLYICYCMCTVFTVMGIMAYLTASPFLYQTVVGLSATEYGLTALVLCATVFTSGFINSRLITRFKSESILLVGSILMLSSGLLFLIFDALSMINVYTILISAMVFFVTMPLSFANAGSLALKSVSKNYGAASALFSSLQFLGGVLSSTYISLAETSNLRALGNCIVFIGIGFFIFLSLASKKRLTYAQGEA